MNNRKLILLVGKSGSGKTTMANYLEKHFGLKQLNSYTTRQPRFPNEKGHEFITYEAYVMLKNKVATTYFDKHYYCATQEQCDTSDIYIIDPDGLRSFKRNYNGTRPYKVIYLEVNVFKRFRRMLKRGDGVFCAMKRLFHDYRMFYRFKEKPGIITIKNNNIDSTALQIFYNT